VLSQTLLNIPRNTSYPYIPDVIKRAPVAVDLSDDEEDSKQELSQEVSGGSLAGSDSSSNRQ